MGGALADEAALREARDRTCASLPRDMKPTFFETPADFRAWLESNHDTEQELWVGFHKKGTGRRSITWPEAVDQALCFGWIDSVRRSVDGDSYMTRFTPRKARSTWSEVNIKRAEELMRQGLMHPAGRAAYERRTEERSGIYSYEQRKEANLTPAQERSFRANVKAWEFFLAQTPSYRRAVIWWVVSAKREETRRKRLAQLIEDSARGRFIAAFARRPRRD
jgi:uncharacterized protein YdeI (YjbR/CyaY-like superfamily)